MQEPPWPPGGDLRLDTGKFDPTRTEWGKKDNGIGAMDGMEWNEAELDLTEITMGPCDARAERAETGNRHKG